MALLSEATIRAVAIEAYGAVDGSISRIRHGVSAIYRCDTREQGGRVLRFTHECLIPRRSAEANAAYLEHLAAHDAPVSELVRPDGGGTVLSVPEAGEPFLATAVRELPGRALSPDDHDPKILGAWGKAMAALHVAAERFEPPDPGAYLDEDAHWHETLDALPIEDNLARAEWSAVESWWREPAIRLGDRGLTHADMNATNAIWDGSRVALIDFDEPIWHAFASDLARPLREMTHLPAHLRAAAREALLAGYRSRRELAVAWEETLPWFVRMKQLEMYASVLSSGSDPVERDPAGIRRDDFIAERRREFERHARKR